MVVSQQEWRRRQVVGFPRRSKEAAGKARAGERTLSHPRRSLFESRWVAHVFEYLSGVVKVEPLLVDLDRVQDACGADIRG